MLDRFAVVVVPLYASAIFCSKGFPGRIADILTLHANCHTRLHISQKQPSKNTAGHVKEMVNTPRAAAE